MRTIAQLTLVLLLALATLPLARAADAPSYDTLVSQAQSLDRDGERLAAFGCYLQAYRLQPESAPATAALLKAVRSGTLPIRVPESMLQAAVDTTHAVQITPLLDGKVMAVTSRDELDTFNDPQNGWPFTRCEWFYRASTDPAGEYVLYASVRWQSADDRALAERTGQLLAVLRAALTERTGNKPLTDGKPFNVWLCRHATDAGGEQWRNSIYFYQVGEQRSSIEWIREIAHEYSHMAFPIVGGDYSDPEPWANGYYGERLLLRWLSRGAAGGPAAVEKAWGGTFAGYPNFDIKLIAPPLSLYTRNGLSDEWLARRDRQGMDYLIGMLLAIDDKAGPQACARLLWDLPQAGLVDPAQLLPGARQALATAKPTAKTQATRGDR
ncbi:MAG TPA: hypothetical protein VGK19_12985 [Capsulimonadaceae bacterium]|jgi:hypothetical protein